MAVPYKVGEILAMRADGATWAEIGEHYGRAGNTVNEWFRAHVRTASDEDSGEGGAEQRTTDPELLTREDISRIRSLDDLVTFFDIDLEKWEVQRFRVNKWEQNSVAEGITPLYQVRADLVRNRERYAQACKQAMENALEDIKVHAPNAFCSSTLSGTSEPVMFELALMDPHLGMLAWAEETGNDFDLAKAQNDYNNAADHLLAIGTTHNPERILVVVGNDTIHIDTLDQGKIGTTTKGTPQDFDSRLPKLFDTARRCIVRTIDGAMSIAERVDVMVVGGNHDELTMYKLGVVLDAWYRNTPQVNVLNAPRLRKYYGYGRNLLGFTHGLEFKRKRENLALIMLDEAPREGFDLRELPVREWHMGHHHAAGELSYMSPAETLSETRSIRLRSLPGLTAIDAWHDRAGYSHLRSATGLVFRRAGGLAGLYEYHPTLDDGAEDASA